SKPTSSWSSPTRSTSATPPAVKPTSVMRRGLPTCSRTGSSGAASCRPARIQALRDLTRTRKQLVREVAQHALRIQKVLEDANLKVASVALQHPRQERARDARR